MAIFSEITEKSALKRETLTRQLKFNVCNIGSLDKKDNTGVNTVLNTGLNTGVNTGVNTGDNT